MCSLPILLFLNYFLCAEHKIMEYGSKTLALYQEFRELNNKMRQPTCEKLEDNLIAELETRKLNLQKIRLIVSSKDYFMFKMTSAVKVKMRLAKSIDGNEGGTKITFYVKRLGEKVLPHGPTAFIFYSPKPVEEAIKIFREIYPFTVESNKVANGFTSENIDSIKTANKRYFALKVEQDEWSVMVGIDELNK